MPSIELTDADRNRIADIVLGVGPEVVHNALERLGPNDVVGRSLNVEGLTCTVEELRVFTAEATS